MNTIKSVEQIKKLSGRIYVRWSKSISLDKKRGYSLAYGTQAEQGLSACEIDKSWDTWRILRQLQEYSFCGGSCWIVRGDEVGRGQDNEPVLANVELIGKASDQLVNADWLKMWRDEKLNQDAETLDRITDKFAIEIVKRSISRLESNDRGTWQKMLNGR